MENSISTYSRRNNTARVVKALPSLFFSLYPPATPLTLLACSMRPMHDQLTGLDRVTNPISVQERDDIASEDPRNYISCVLNYRLDNLINC